MGQNITWNPSNRLDCDPCLFFATWYFAFITFLRLDFCNEHLYPASCGHLCRDIRCITAIRFNPPLRKKDHMSLFTTLFSSKPLAEPAGPQDVVALVGNSKFEIKISGAEQHQFTLESICGPYMSKDDVRYEFAQLILEHNNRRDNNAVRVEIRGKAVGFLGPQHAISYRHQLSRMGASKATGRCQAMIQGGWVSSDGRKGEYEVWLDLPFLCK